MYATGKSCIRYGTLAPTYENSPSTLVYAEIRSQYVTNMLQYVGIRCHMKKWAQNCVLFHTFDIS